MSVAAAKPEVVEDCVCIPPMRQKTQIAQDIYERTNGHSSLLPWDVAAPLALFGVVVARSIAEKKHYEGFLSRTHTQCPKHDVVFWPITSGKPAGNV